ncbi:MAG: cytochrome c3 family protein, partial [Candidatus Latescibacterota bacterium]|nr:cytochrome c3 family protein [Candidatus Latescibacterota bacterium]
MQLLDGCLILFLLLDSLGAKEHEVTIPEQDRAALIHFSHQAHLNDYGLVCADCHFRADSSTKSSDNILPREADCTNCHAQELADENCSKCHKVGAERVAFSSPERVIDFHHQYHTETLKLGCETCHQGMGRTDYATRESWPVMDDCLTCHQDKDAPFDCATCHPQVEVIRPRSHRQDWMYEHKQHV